LIEARKRTSVTAYEQDDDDGTINTFNTASACNLSRQESSSTDVRNEVLGIVADDLDARYFHGNHENV
jgi:hypothetical protein